MEKINFKNKDDLNIVGALHKSSDVTTAVIIAHGFTSNKERPRHVQLADALADDAITALRIDFGGSGESDDREITIAAQINDLHSAIEYLNNEGYEKIGVLGEGLGGITALKAFNENIKAMVLWAPVTKASWTAEISDEQQKSLDEKGYYLREKDNREFKIPKEYFDERMSLDREAVLSKVAIPVLIVHGTADKTIPILDSEEAIQFLPEGSKLERIENWEHGDHKMDSDMDTIIPITVKWFKEHL